MRCRSGLNSGFEGAEIWPLDIHRDARGALTAFERGHNLPFVCRRVFTIQVKHGRVDRGGHANSCDEFVVALMGAVSVRVDNGGDRRDFRLASPDEGLWIRPGVMIELGDFEPNTLLLVCASETYAETQHFDRPQPQLLLASSAA